VNLKYLNSIKFWFNRLYWNWPYFGQRKLSLIWPNLGRGRLGQICPSSIWPNLVRQNLRHLFNFSWEWLGGIRIGQLGRISTMSTRLNFGQGRLDQNFD